MYWTLLNEVLAIHQEQRLAKNYVVSDRIRKVFNNLGMDIIQGHGPNAKYEDLTPEQRRHPYRQDTFVVNEKRTREIDAERIRKRDEKDPTTRKRLLLPEKRGT